MRTGWVLGVVAVILWAATGATCVNPSPDRACTSNGDCGLGEYCKKPDGACDGPGECTRRPEACTLEFAPVCGCDGQTYSNACHAAAAGVNVAYQGECESVAEEIHTP